MGSRNLKRALQERYAEIKDLEREINEYKKTYYKTIPDGVRKRIDDIKTEIGRINTEINYIIVSLLDAAEKIMRNENRISAENVGLSKSITRSPKDVRSIGYKPIGEYMVRIPETRKKCKLSILLEQYEKITQEMKVVDPEHANEIDIESKPYKRNVRLLLSKDLPDRRNRKLVKALKYADKKGNLDILLSKPSNNNAPRSLGDGR